jgi:retron-type reverse transcriptase
VKISDKEILHGVKSLLTAGVINEGSLQETKEGTPQGGILSPCLANIYLRDFDIWLQTNWYVKQRYYLWLRKKHHRKNKDWLYENFKANIKGYERWYIKTGQMTFLRKHAEFAQRKIWT